MIECWVRTNSRTRFWESVYRCPALSAKSLLFTPNFCSPEICCRISSVVYGVAMIGALYRCASFGIAPIWSRCPCEQTIALTVPSIRVHHRIIRYRLDLDQIKGVHILDLRVLVDHYLVQAESHVKYDNFLSAADGGHIPPDLVVSAHCDNFYIHFVSPYFSVLVYSA